MKKIFILFGCVLFQTVNPKPYTPVYTWEMHQEISKKIAFQNEVDKICAVIRFKESRGNYQVRGQSGEIGAYQIMPGNWDRWAKKFLNEHDLQVTPDNQDRLVAALVTYYLESGYSVHEIASIWNSGSPNWEGKIGVNKYGVPYNVPAYVEDFYRIYSGIDIL